MKRSRSEIEALARKAALGAGVPLGQAEDLGRVAVFLAGTDLGCVTDALLERQVPLDVTWDADAVTIKAGTAAMAAPVVRDALEMGLMRAVLPKAQHLPFVVAVLGQAGFAVSCQNLTIQRVGEVSPDVSREPVNVHDHIWIQWEALAARTYVPQSAVSRASGAGAGLTDTD